LHGNSTNGLGKCSNTKRPQSVSKHVLPTPVEPTPNCGQSDVSTVALGNVGTLWSFTVIRHRPPGDYRGPTPFAPFGLGLVELTEGLRVLSPIDVDVDALEIGLPLRFHPYVRHDPEKDVVAFSYVPNLGATLDV
jgi:uncharacterized OB-fold protein